MLLSTVSGWIQLFKWLHLDKIKIMRIIIVMKYIRNSYYSPINRMSWSSAQSCVEPPYGP